MEKMGKDELKKALQEAEVPFDNGMAKPELQKLYDEAVSDGVIKTAEAKTEGAAPEKEATPKVETSAKNAQAVVFVTKNTVAHDGIEYPAGSQIQLDADSAEALLKCGAVEAVVKKSK